MVIWRGSNISPHNIQTLDYQETDSKCAVIFRKQVAHLHIMCAAKHDMEISRQQIIVGEKVPLIISQLVV